MFDFPQWFRFPLGKGIDIVFTWVVDGFGKSFKAFTAAVLQVMVPLEQFMKWIPWWIIVLLVAFLAWHSTRKWRVAIGMALLMTLIGTFGMWELAMSTLSLVLVSTLSAIFVGVPVGILMSYNDTLKSTMRPVLDAMQTLPSFVYLIPVMFLFGLGTVSAIIATLVYAVPPVIRLTDLGIRQVDKAVLEAAESFGSSKRQILLGVQLPLAMPTIMAGINQTIMMALAMVVIASMIGARGLGMEVLRAIQRGNVGLGFESGLSIVALAIIIDRITQGYARQTRSHE